MDDDDLGIAAGRHLGDVAIRQVIEAGGRVRVEDYLTVLAAATGEAALVAAGIFDLEHNELSPGAPVFGDATNAVLSGDELSAAMAPEHSVAGIMWRGLVPHVVPLSVFPDLGDVYRHVAATAGVAPWGHVSTSVPEDNRPTVIPLRAAYEMRGAVDDLCEQLSIPATSRHEPCAHAVVEAVDQVQGSTELAMALRLTLEVLFAMAKTVPMSREAFARLSGEGSDDDGD